MNQAIMGPASGARLNDAAVSTAPTATRPKPAKTAQRRRMSRPNAMIPARPAPGSPNRRVAGSEAVAIAPMPAARSTSTPATGTDHGN